MASVEIAVGASKVQGILHHSQRSVNAVVLLSGAGLMGY